MVQLEDIRVGYIAWKDFRSGATCVVATHQSLPDRLGRRQDRADFDAAGKPDAAPVDDAWTIRNISYDFTAAPYGDNPERRYP